VRTYIPIAELEHRDPAWAQRVRKRDREKCRRLREKNPEKFRAYARSAYAKNPEMLRAKTKAWRLSNPEKAKETKENYKKNSRAKYIVQSVRSAAKQKGVVFDISVEWVQRRLDDGVCELSGLPFDFFVLKDMPSIDRRIPGGDYVESNCRLILFGLNSLLRRSGDAGIPYAVTRIHELRAGA
jgi:hypothetical protein